MGPERDPAPLAVPAPRPANTLRHQIRDVRLTLPTGGWQRTDDPVVDGEAQTRLTLIREQGVHQYELRVVVVPWSVSFLTNEEVASQFLEGISQGYRESLPAGMKGDCRKAPRTIAGSAYPTLACKLSAPGLVVDMLALVYLPNDRQERHRIYVLIWEDLHSASVPADLAEFDAIFSALELVPLGEELLADVFDHPEGGRLSRQSADPERFAVGYVEGEYAIRKVDPDATTIWRSHAPGTYEDSTIAVDVRFIGNASSPTAYLYCRRFGSPESGYRLAFHGPSGRARLTKLSEGTSTILVDWREAPALNGPDGFNRVELNCSSDLISYSVNGHLVGAARDDGYGRGGSSIGAGMGAPVDGVAAEVRFDNLSITQA